MIALVFAVVAVSAIISMSVAAVPPAASAAGAKAAPATAAGARAAAAPYYGPWFKHVNSFWLLPQQDFKPVRLAVSADGVWVSDQGDDQIVRFDLDGSAPDSWAGEGTSGEALNGPCGVALNNDASQLFVADAGNHRIVVVATHDWSVLQEIGGGRGSGNGQFDGPCDVDVWAGGDVPPGDGVLYVADTGNDRVVKYTYNAGSGEWVYAAKWGSPGTGAGAFSSPAGIAVDHHRRNVWVADTGNDRIQVFGQNGGAPMLVFGASGSGAGRFSTPQDLAFIPSPLTLLAADEGNNRVQEWSIGTGGALTATSRRSFGAVGTRGQGRMQRPQGVAVDKGQKGDMYVADTDNRRVQLWRRDTVGPRTYARKQVTVTRGRKARLTYKLSDLSDRCNVQIAIYRRGVKKKTLRLGWRTSGGWQTAAFTCTLKPGTYTWKVFAKDRAGNDQRSPIGARKLVVKR